MNDQTGQKSTIRGDHDILPVEGVSPTAQAHGTNTTPSPAGDGTPLPAIIGGCVGALVIIGIVILAVYIWYRRKYPVRMVLGKDFQRFSNPAYNTQKMSTLKLVVEDPLAAYDEPMEQINKGLVLDEEDVDGGLPTEYNPESPTLDRKDSFRSNSVDAEKSNEGENENGLQDSITPEKRKSRQALLVKSEESEGFVVVDETSSETMEDTDSIVNEITIHRENSDKAIEIDDELDEAERKAHSHAFENENFSNDNVNKTPAEDNRSEIINEVNDKVVGETDSSDFEMDNTSTSEEPAKELEYTSSNKENDRTPDNPDLNTNKTSTTEDNGDSYPESTAVETKQNICENITPDTNIHDIPGECDQLDLIKDYNPDHNPDTEECDDANSAVVADSENDLSTVDYRSETENEDMSLSFVLINSETDLLVDQPSDTKSRQGLENSKPLSSDSVESNGAIPVATESSLEMDETINDGATPNLKNVSINDATTHDENDAPFDECEPNMSDIVSKLIDSQSMNEDEQRTEKHEQASGQNTLTHSPEDGNNFTEKTAESSYEKIGIYHERQESKSPTSKLPTEFEELNIGSISEHEPSTFETRTLIPDIIVDIGLSEVSDKAENDQIYPKDRDKESLLEENIDAANLATHILTPHSSGIQSTANEKQNPTSLIPVIRRGAKLSADNIVLEQPPPTPTVIHDSIILEPDISNFDNKHKSLPDVRQERAFTFDLVSDTQKYPNRQRNSRSFDNYQGLKDSILSESFQSLISNKTKEHHSGSQSLHESLDKVDDNTIYKTFNEEISLERQFSMSDSNLFTASSEKHYSLDRLSDSLDDRQQLRNEQNKSEHASELSEISRIEKHKDDLAGEVLSSYEMPDFSDSMVIDQDKHSLIKTDTFEMLEEMDENVCDMPIKDAISKTDEAKSDTESNTSSEPDFHLDYSLSTDSSETKSWDIVNDQSIPSPTEAFTADTKGKVDTKLLKVDMSTFNFNDDCSDPTDESDEETKDEDEESVEIITEDESNA